MTPTTAPEAAWRHLVAAATHDLRIPVTSLRLLAEAVDDQIVDAAVRREYLTRMRIHIDALAALIDDLFELARVEAGDLSWSMERVRVGDLVAETVTAMAVHAELKRVAVRAELPDGLAVVRANREKLKRVLFNLVQNAIHHTPAHGTVIVRAEAVTDAIEVEVADTGTGIAPEERPHVFAPFYRADSDASSGAGLGLAVARTIVEAHGGRIWLPSGPHGTRVRFTLPVAGAMPGQSAVIEP